MTTWRVYISLPIETAGRSVWTLEVTLSGKTKASPQPEQQLVLDLGCSGSPCRAQEKVTPTVIGLLSQEGDCLNFLESLADVALRADQP